MDSRTLLELHPAVFAGKPPLDSTDLPWCESQPSREISSLSLVVGPDDGLVWAKADEGAGGRIQEVGSPDEADAGFCFLALGRKNYLGLVSLRSGILVNGAPSLSFAVLTTRDSILLRPGHLAYVTTRVNPFVGRPSDDLLGKKCRFCSIPIDESTQVVVCVCGQPFHHETPESHPEVSPRRRGWPASTGSKSASPAERISRWSPSWSGIQGGLNDHVWKTGTSLSGASPGPNPGLREVVPVARQIQV